MTCHMEGGGQWAVCHHDPVHRIEQTAAEALAGAGQLVRARGHPLDGCSQIGFRVVAIW